MHQEQILKQIPKQRQRTYEYEAPFPVPELPVNISDELLDKLLTEIDDETLGTEA